MNSYRSVRNRNVSGLPVCERQERGVRRPPDGTRRVGHMELHAAATPAPVLVERGAKVRGRAVSPGKVAPSVERSRARRIPSTHGAPVISKGRVVRDRPKGSSLEEATAGVNERQCRTSACSATA